MRPSPLKPPSGYNDGEGGGHENVTDAGFGADLILSVAYQDLEARRVLDLCAHETDKDPHNWLLRRHDDKGRPLCPFGYRLVSNGYDAERQRRKYFCNRTCTQGGEPVVQLDAIPRP